MQEMNFQKNWSKAAKEANRALEILDLKIDLTKIKI